MGNCILMATNVLECKNIRSLKYVFSLSFTPITSSFSTFTCQLATFLADSFLLKEFKNKAQTVSMFCQQTKSAVTYYTFFFFSAFDSIFENKIALFFSLRAN